MLIASYSVAIQRASARGVFEIVPGEGEITMEQCNVKYFGEVAFPERKSHFCSMIPIIPTLQGIVDLLRRLGGISR